MDELIGFLIDSWGRTWWVVIPVIFFAVLHLSPLGKLWENDADRKRWIGWLIQNRWQKRYADIMGGWLDWLDGKLSAREIEEQKTQGRVAWSLGLLDLLMLLAVAYPVLSFVTQWIAGSSLTFGGQDIAPKGTGQSRVFVGIWLGGSLVLYTFSLILKSRWRVPSFNGANAILFGGLFFSDRLGIPAEIAFAVAFAGAVAVAVAVLYLEDKDGKRRWRLIYLGALLCTVSTVILWFWQPGNRDSSAYTPAPELP